MGKVPLFPVQLEPTQWSELTILAATILLEADGEPDDGYLAVGWVVMNRMRLWNQTLKQVVYGPDGIPDDMYEPFSAWNVGDRAWALRKLGRAGVAEKAWKYAAAALWGLLPDPTKGATFYLNPDLTRKIRSDHGLPSWYDAKKVVMKIGAHEFLALG